MAAAIPRAPAHSRKVFRPERLLRPLFSCQPAAKSNIGSAKFAARLQFAARASLFPGNWGEGGIRTHGTVTRTTVFEFYDSHAGLCRQVTKRVLQFGIFNAIILFCDGPCQAVLRSWFAIWFANSLYRPMSALEGKVDIPNPHLDVRF